MKITIKYYVDNPNFSDADFDDEPQRTFVIDKNKLSDILRTFGDLRLNEFLHEVEVETSPN